MQDNLPSTRLREIQIQATETGSDVTSQFHDTTLIVDFSICQNLGRFIKGIATIEMRHITHDLFVSRADPGQPCLAQGFH